MQKTWVLVADAHGAEIWTCNARQEIHLIKAIEPKQAHQFQRQINSDKPGRAFATSGGRRSTLESHHEPLDQERAVFVLDLAAELKKEAADGSFDKLALIAPPKMLGALRGAIGEPTTFKVIADQPKDLMKLSRTDMEAHIRSLIGPQ